MNEEKSTLATSFLDVLSCGLGASILLFLVFSVLPHKGLTPTGGQPDFVAGNSGELTEVGVNMNERLKVKSADLAIVLMFTVEGEIRENPGLTLQKLENGVVFEGVAPILPASVRTARGRELAPGDAQAEFVTVKDQSGQPLSFLVRRTIPGGQKKGHKIIVKVTTPEALQGTIQVTGNENPIGFNVLANTEVEITIDFSSERLILIGKN